MNRRAVAAGAAALVLCTGCAPARWDRSGAVAHPQELLIAANDDGGTEAYQSGLGGATGITRFIEEVSRLSHGRVTVRIDDSGLAGGTEADVIKDVGDGKVDLGWVGARSLAGAGVDAFRPLDVPFLIDSYAAQAAVVTGAVADRMLAALKPRGLTGLALVAGELELPLSTGRPLLTPADYRDHPFALTGTVTPLQGISGLGAQPTSLQPGQYIDDIQHYAASWWTLANHGPLTGRASVTANTPLWAHTMALFGSSSRLAGLDPEVQGWLRQAAREASDWSAVHASDGVAFEAQVACGNGAGFVTAAPGQVASLRATTAEALRGLGSAAVTAQVTTGIQEAVRSVRPEPAHAPATCAPFDGTTAGRLTDPWPARPGRPGALPAGVYRYSVSEDEMRASGVNDTIAHAIAGVWTWTLRDGSWRYDFAPAANDIPDGYAFATCRGWYDVVGSSISFGLDPADPSGGACAPYAWGGQWQIAPQGLRLTLHQPNGDPNYLFSGKLWERIA